ncbi:MAG: CBS domain-containing protein [Ghiorsea sp.]
MLAEQIMMTNLVTALEDESVAEVFEKMRDAKLRMLPVLDKQGCVTGVLSTFCVMQHIVPDYVISGDLKQISYAPDMGLLRRHYSAIADKSIKEVMQIKPLLVSNKESLLSVAASLSAFGRHEYALVVDDKKKLLGVISAGDILDRLKLKTVEVSDA